MSVVLLTLREVEENSYDKNTIKDILVGRMD